MSVPEKISLTIDGEVFESEVIEDQEDAGLYKLAIPDYDGARNAFLDFRGRVLTNGNVQFVSINNRNIRTKPDRITIDQHWKRGQYEDYHMGETYPVVIGIL